MRGRLAPGNARGGAGWITLLLVAVPTGAGAVPGVDTVAVRVETGASVEYSNEIFYEDAYIDTTFLGRQLVDTPEPRYAGVLTTRVEGTRGGRRASYRISNEASLGDKIQRDVLSLEWRDQLDPDWRLTVHPAFEWRHDQSFGRDERHWGGSLGARLRRDFDDAATGIELGALTDLSRTSGVGSEFLPDRNAARGSLALDHLGLLGQDWRLAYSFASRVFPDSATRDHYEHMWEGHWRRPLPGGHVVSIEAIAHRRQTHRIVTTTRDNFWEETAAVEGDWRTADRWAVTTRLEGEAFQYDLEEPLVYFDYQVMRAALGLRYESGAHWVLTAGPRAERLVAPLDPDEAYREMGGAAALEVLGAHSLWDVTPAAGWRSYDGSRRDAIAAGLHSSYAFYQLDAFIDQPLMNRMRLRVMTTLRYESHTDPSQNAGSLLLSFQMRWGAD